MTARELADKNNSVIVKTSSTSGCPTTCSPAPRPATTTRSCRSCSRRCTATATWSSRRRSARSARRPAAPCRTATSRAPARSAGTPSARGDQCDNCGNQLDPTDLINPRSKINGETPEFVETQHFFLDLPALADALKEYLARARGVRHLAAQRHQVLPEPPRGPPAAGDDPRHRLGHPGADRGLARAADQAALRLVRRGDRLPVGLDRVGPAHRRPRALARVVERPRGAVLLLHGQGQHRLPLPRSGRPSCWPTTARATRAASRGSTAAEPAHRGRLQRSS